MTVQDTGIAGGEQAAALAPVRAHLLGAARAEADRILGQARDQAAATLRQARRDAEEAVRQARERGQAETATTAAAERRRGREQARSIVLGAQRETHEELRGQVLAAAGGLRDEPGYERLLAGLTALAARAAGPGATVAADEAGGVVARTSRAVVDCSLPRLASLAVDALGDQVRELWTP